MGASESNQQDEHRDDQSQSNQDEDQHALTPIHDSNYGQCELHTNEQNQVMALKQRIFNAEDEYHHFNENIHNSSQFSHPSLISVQDVKTVVEEGFCGSFYSVKYSLEYVPKTLENVIYERMGRNLRFTETEIINVISDVLQGLGYLLLNEINHCNVTTSSILITNTGGSKIFVPASINQQTHYVQVMMKMCKQCFLSPELFQSLLEQEVNPKCNQEKSDVFSLGVIALTMALLGRTEGIYDFDQVMVNADIVNEKLNQLRKNYSQDLTDVIQAFLMEEEERCDFKQALALLQNIKKNPMEDFKEQEQVKRHGRKAQERYESPVMSKQSHIQSQQTPARSVLNESPVVEQLKKKSSYSTLKEIDSLVNNAIDQSKQTQAKYLDSQATRNKLKDLLQDEVFVPLQPSPYNKQNKQMKQSLKVVKTSGWKK